MYFNSRFTQEEISTYLFTYALELIDCGTFNENNPSNLNHQLIKQFKRKLRVFRMRENGDFLDKFLILYFNT